MTYKIFFSVILTLFFIPTNLWSCGGEAPYFEPPRYIDETSIDGYIDEFNKLFNIYYGEEYHLDLDLAYKEYVKKIQNLENKKNIKKSMGTSLNSTYYFGAIPSNSYQSSLNFITAAFDDDQVTGGWEDLIRLRHEILQMYQSQKSDEILKDIQKLDAKIVGGYGTYLEATYYFYTGAYEKALAIYSKLKSRAKPLSIISKMFALFKKNSQTNWLEETAAYMEARILLIMAQDKISGYESDAELKEKLDLGLLNRSYDLFQDYLKDYPQGRYADSAKNLQRKFYRLKGQRDEFNKALREDLNLELAKGADSPRVHQLMCEFDRNFSGQIKLTDSPILITYYVQTNDLEPKKLQTVLNALDQQKNRFAPFPELFNFLRALVLYKLERHQDLVTSIPDPVDIKKNDIVLISTEVLRAKSFRELGDYQKALTVLNGIKHFNDDHIDLLILKTHIALKSPKEVILKDLGSERVIQAFIVGGLSDNELKTLAKDNNSSLSKKTIEGIKVALLRRYIITGQLKEALEIDGPTYENLGSIKSQIQALLKKPDDNKSLLEVGKWLMESPFSPTTLPEDLKMECSECLVSISLVPPLHYFIKIINNFQVSKQKSIIESETLHYLIDTCFHHGRAAPYSCKWRDEYGHKPEEIELQEMRKNDVPAWFRKLHKVYKGSPWAQKTPYCYK